jgi:hypothetical protein
MPLIRVLEIPPTSGNFHFRGGEAQPFVEVDWFRDDSGPSMSTPEGRNSIEAFIKGKKYFDPKKAYLVLHQDATFTLGYLAP